MIRNYFKIAWRNLWKNKGYSFINIFGLAIGITCASLILLWVEDEVNFDQAIPDKELVFAVPTNQKYDGEWRTFFQATPGPLAAVLKAEIPEITKSARKRDIGYLFNVGEKSVNSAGSFADKDLIDIFGLNFIAGNPKDAFKEKKSVIITQKIASIFFDKSDDAIGKNIQFDKKETFVITAVVKDFPENTSFTFDWLAPFENFTDGKEWTQGYGANFTDTFVKLAAGSDVEKVNEKVKAILPAKTGDAETEAILFSANDWHLRSKFENGKIDGGRIEYVRLFSFIALIILIIACINFMNLSTARSEKRANEVGMRKALGSGRKQLIFQFLTEAVLTAFISGIVSLLLLIALIPQFNLLIDKNLSLAITAPIHFLPIVIITLFCGIISGLYPAFYLSSFKPIEVLKGSRRQSGSASFTRKTLVVIQFSISIIFIISTLLVYQQVQHIKNRNLGMVKENLIEMPAANGDIIKNFKSIEQELTSSGLVESVALMNSQILSGGNNTSGIDWQGKTTDADILISIRTVTPQFFNTAGMVLKEGKGFTSSEAVDSTKVLISESFAKLMATDNVVGNTIDYNGQLLTINGVVKDFLYGDMYGTSDPVMFYHQAEEADYMYIKPAVGVEINKTLAAIESVLKTQNPGFPFEYRFVDEAFNERFKSEQLVENLSQIFAVLAIIISCLGLFGLSAFTAEQRRKEIGVRKVLGSSVLGIVKLLSKDFLVLVLLSILISVPISWYVMQNWLQGFAYRIDIKLWVFAIAGFSAVLIALITVSFQAIKAAIANPVKSLRTE
ncbi:Macrolide export ATP-binding/permease protein MacB [Aequorivita lipolytica]|uniref:FtsX-like permease family protein n=2 Tax=Aequorivita lipolytica TaxID=153267 RepID=A0A5C6YP22_9FLAO|nr:ABC transporter permease [Aequorivita lipolytica]TXD69049.1 FtsX-like permease family protein [Aequorivita lipolytica]SRX53054.1 Macrolide export ATP-binding/permease protein MacB [Aequorivita lipolytica]